MLIIFSTTSLIEYPSVRISIASFAFLRGEIFLVDSAGTGSWHIGKRADTRMRIASQKRGVEILSRARQINLNDFEKFTYIVAMDDSNYENIVNLKSRKSSSDFSSIKKIQNFRSIFQETEVPDPYFGGDEGFDHVLDILEDSVSGFLDTIS